MPSQSLSSAPSPMPGMWWQEALAFLDAVLRGISQVMLQNNRYTGLLFLAGIFYNSRLFGAVALVGTIVSTGTARLLGARSEQLRNGVFGFNGALVAIALAYFFEPGKLMWIYLMFAAAMSTVLMAGLLRWLRERTIAPLTAPFVLVALCFLLADASFGRLHPTHLLPAAALPQVAVVKGVVGWTTVWQGLGNSVAQVFFQHNIVTGLLFLIGLLISSRRVFMLALCGALIGVLVSWALGAPEADIRAGVFGFNSVLTVIAVGALTTRRRWMFLPLAGAAAIAATLVFAAVSAALRPLGMPALTAPFVLVTWAFVLATGHFMSLPSEATRVDRSV